MRNDGCYQVTDALSLRGQPAVEGERSATLDTAGPTPVGLTAIVWNENRGQEVDQIGECPYRIALARLLGCAALVYRTLQVESRVGRRFSEHNCAFLTVHRPSPPCELYPNPLLDERQLVATVLGIGESELQQAPTNEFLGRPTVDG